MLAFLIHAPKLPLPKQQHFLCVYVCVRCCVCVCGAYTHENVTYILNCCAMPHNLYSKQGHMSMPVSLNYSHLYQHIFVYMRLLLYTSQRRKQESNHYLIDNITSMNYENNQSDAFIKNFPQPFSKWRIDCRTVALCI